MATAPQKKQPLEVSARSNKQQLPATYLKSNRVPGLKGSAYLARKSNRVPELPGERTGIREPQLRQWA